MWSFFSRDPTSTFNYEIGEKVAGLEEKSVWTLHKGKKKTGGEPVSIFCCDAKTSSEPQLVVAKSAYKRLRTLRHPNILTFLDGIETDKVVYMVTEPVVPLETYLSGERGAAGDAKNELAIAWGLHQIVKGLSFLVNDVNLVHNNVCMASIFVDRAGEWRLGGVEYMYPVQGTDSHPPVKILPALERYDPPEKADSASRGKPVASEKWSADMWGLGCLIWEAFNGPLPKTTSLKAIGKLPKALQASYATLVSANPRSRPNPGAFIQDCRRSAGFMANKFVDTMLFLEEIQIKDAAAKNDFFSCLAPELDSFPVAMNKHKILPQLLTAFEFGSAGSGVLAPLFKLGKLLDSEEYQQKIVPCVVKMFSSTDRQTRVKLLQQMDQFVEHLHVSTVNDQIFPNVAQGFLDTNPVVRESTIKAMVFLGSKLNYKNLNEELMKHFARLQAKDEQGGIRTNTTVCLGKVACHLNPGMRQKVLPAAFTRGLRDPFPPARQAAALAIMATHTFYPITDIGTRVLPALCAAAASDPEKSVRDQVFKAIKSLIDRLEKLSENPELASDYEKDLLSGSSGGTSSADPASWSGWAMTGFSSLTSKLVKTRPATANQQQPSAAAGTGAGAAAAGTKPLPGASAAAAGGAATGVPAAGDVKADIKSSQSRPPASRSIVGPAAAATDAEDDVEETADDWGNLDDNLVADDEASAGGGKASSAGSGGGGGGGGWDDDWQDNDFAPLDDPAVAPASSYNWDKAPSRGSSEGSAVAADDFFTALTSSNAKPAAKKPATAAAAVVTSASGKSLSAAAAATPSGAVLSGAAAKHDRVAPATAAPTAWPAETAGGWDDNWTDDWGGGGGGGRSSGRSAGDWDEQKSAGSRQPKDKPKPGGGMLKLGAKKVAAD